MVSGATGPQLSFSPGRIDPTNPAFNTSRKPLAGEFTFIGNKLFVICWQWPSVLKKSLMRRLRVTRSKVRPNGEGQALATLIMS